MEYVSDMEESDEEDAGDLEEWLSGQSADGDDGSSEEDDDNDDSSDDGNQEQDFTPKKPITGAKRKAGKPLPLKRASKGPKMEVEYENTAQEPLREAVPAR